MLEVPINIVFVGTFILCYPFLNRSIPEAIDISEAFYLI